MNVAILAVFALLLIVDIATTRYIVTHGGHELNPIYQGNPTIEKLIFTHALVLGAAGYVLLHWPESTFAGLVCTAIYLAVCVFNLYEARTLSTEKKS